MLSSDNNSTIQRLFIIDLHRNLCLDQIVDPQKITSREELSHESSIYRRSPARLIVDIDRARCNSGARLLRRAENCSITKREISTGWPLGNVLSTYMYLPCLHCVHTMRAATQPSTMSWYLPEVASRESGHLSDNSATYLSRDCPPVIVHAHETP